MSKARSAVSKPIGGFFVNRCLLEEVLQKYLTPQKLTGKLKTGLDLYRKWRRNDLSLRGVSDEQKHFIQQFDALSHEIEDAKLTLSRSIMDWRLDAPLNLSVPVAIPANPFSTSRMVNCQLSAAEFRDVFVKRIWQQQLKEVVKKALDLGRDELSGAPITVVLLSGGTSAPAAVWPDASTDLCGAERVALRLLLQNPSRGGGSEPCLRNRFRGSK